MSSRILPILALAIAVGIFFVYVKPLWSGPIAETKAAIAMDERTLTAAKEYNAKQNELASARNAIDAENLNRLITLLPDSVDNVGLILDINALAARSGLSLSNVDITNKSSVTESSAAAVPDGSVGPLVHQDPVSSLELSVSAIGTYSALQSFLEGLEKSARLLDVQDISVKGSDTGVYGYQLSVRLYWLR